MELFKHARTDHMVERSFKPQLCDAAALWSSTLSPAPAPCEESCIKLPHHINKGPTPNNMPSQNMLTLAILIWPGLPVALGAAFWAVDLIGRITRCKEGELLPRDPPEKQRLQVGRSSVGPSAGWGLWPWSHSASSWEGAWRHAGRPGVGTERNLARPWGKKCFSLYCDSSYCTLLFSAQSHKDWKPLSDSKAFLLTPSPSAHAL